jgi:hypothetical protein
MNLTKMANSNNTVIGSHLHPAVNDWKPAEPGEPVSQCSSQYPAGQLRLSPQWHGGNSDSPLCRRLNNLLGFLVFRVGHQSLVNYPAEVIF